MRLEGEADTGLRDDEILVANITRLRTILTEEQGKGVRLLQRDRWIKLLRELYEAPFRKLGEQLPGIDAPAPTRADGQTASNNEDSNHSQSPSGQSEGTGQTDG